MNNTQSTLDFENIFHDDIDAVVTESVDAFSNTTTSNTVATPSSTPIPTPDDLSDGTWRS